MTDPIQSRPINIPANEILAPASANTYRVDGSRPHAVMAQHIDRIADFVEARIDEQFTQGHETRNWDDDPVARSLRALRRVVGEIRSRRALVQHGQDPHLEAAVSLALTFAWGELAAIAREWADHADYRDEFTLLAHQVEAKAATPEAP